MERGQRKDKVGEATKHEIWNQEKLDLDSESNE